MKLSLYTPEFEAWQDRVLARADFFFDRVSPWFILVIIPTELFHSDFWMYLAYLVWMLRAGRDCLSQIPLRKRV